MDCIPGKSVMPWRNWVELPEDVMITILLKVSAIDILCNVQKVCSPWSKICKDPTLWRVVDFHNSRNRFDTVYDLEKMCEEAVNYSSGQLLDINIEYFGTDHLLLHISHTSKQLRRLRVLSSLKISEDGFTEAVSEFPLLEHLEISDSAFSVETLETVGFCSPLLKSLKLNCRRNIMFECDLEAQAIADNMHNLQTLQICCNPLTDRGLEAILYACPHLQSLDLRLCLNLDFAGQLQVNCAESIKNLRYPRDPFDDSETLVELFGYSSHTSFLHFVYTDDEDNDFYF